MSYPLEAQAFDRDNLANMGRPTYFNVDMYHALIEQYITCDEVDLALWLLNHPPAWYRDNPPAASTAIRDRLYIRLFTTLDYATHEVLDPKTNLAHADRKEVLSWLNCERGRLVLDLIQDLNTKGHVPHIVEVAPGNYFIPYGLSEMGCQFTYFAQSLNHQVQKEAQHNLYKHWADTPPKGAKQVFLCFEMIEHLARPEEIYQNYLKRGLDADHVVMSTPKYTYGGGVAEWHTAHLGHLKAYTPGEFSKYAMEYWPRHQFSFYDGNVMVLRGDRR